MKMIAVTVALAALLGAHAMPAHPHLHPVVAEVDGSVVPVGYRLHSGAHPDAPALYIRALKEHGLVPETVRARGYTVKDVSAEVSPVSSFKTLNYASFPESSVRTPAYHVRAYPSEAAPAVAHRTLYQVAPQTVYQRFGSNIAETSAAYTHEPAILAESAYVPETKSTYKIAHQSVAYPKYAADEAVLAESFAPKTYTVSHAEPILASRAVIAPESEVAYKSVAYPTVATKYFHEPALLAESAYIPRTESAYKIARESVAYPKYAADEAVLAESFAPKTYTLSQAEPAYGYKAAEVLAEPVYKFARESVVYPTKYVHEPAILAESALEPEVLLSRSVSHKVVREAAFPAAAPEGTVVSKSAMNVAESVAAPAESAVLADSAVKAESDLKIAPESMVEPAVASQIAPESMVESAVDSQIAA